MSEQNAPSADPLGQIADEFVAELRRGRRPSVEEYARRYPDYADDLRDMLPALAMMEQAKESASGAGAGAPAPAALTLRQLGDYQVLREVGRGGMGVVYEAEQVSLGRRVALKVLPAQAVANEKQRHRFEREARAAAKLHHTNIVPVFGVGEQDGLHYYVMQFIQGLGLDEVLEELRRLRDPASPAAPDSGGSLRVSRREISAAVVAHSLVTGRHLTEDLPSDAGAEPSPPPDATGTFIHPASAGEAPGDPGRPGRLSDTFSLSGSGVTLQGSETAGKRRRGRAAAYWHSVARIGAQVADALRYAHEQGVLHRDVKPGNLLLDTGGTVWVTDFGLAKASDQEDLTHTGDILGTLRYMPPEAFEGRADARGDVYALGLTLYELVALRPAFDERERNRLIKHVTSGEPPSLRKLRPDAPRDLLTIIEKATDRDPARRYQTAGDLAADLQRFQDDEPIQARRITAGERMWRWCRRNPAIASLVACVLLLLVGITVASASAAAHFDRLARDSRANAEREAAERQTAEDNFNEAEKQRRQALDNFNEAEAQRKRAEANFTRAMDVVNDYLVKVTDSQLLQAPGMQPLRQELLRSALAFYQDFLKERGGDANVRTALAATYLRVRNILNDLDDAEGSRKALAEADKLYQELARETPDDPDVRHGRARCLLLNGNKVGAIAIWKGLVRPGEAPYQRELAEALRFQGDDLAAAGQTPEALAAYQEAIVIQQMLVQLAPDDLKARSDLGATLNAIGIQLFAKGRYGEARQMYLRAVEQQQTAYSKAPAVIQFGRSLAVGALNVGATFEREKNSGEALVWYRKANDVWVRLATENPAVPRLQRDMFDNALGLSRWCVANGKPDDAAAVMREARGVIERLPREGPDNLFRLACVRALCAAAVGQDATAEAKADAQKDQDAAADALREAVAAGYVDLNRLRQAPELASVRGREDFKSLLAGLEADVAARNDPNAPGSRLRVNEKALSLREKLAEADPNNRHLRADVAASRHAIALALNDLGRSDEALKAFAEAEAARQKLVEEEPKSAEFRSDLAATRLELGDLHWKAGRLAEGAESWKKALDLLGAVHREAPQDLPTSRRLADAARAVGESYAGARLWDLAAAALGQALEADPDLLGTDPNQAAWQVPFHYRRQALMLLLAGDEAGYREACRRMRERFAASDKPGDLYELGWALAMQPGAGHDPEATIKFTDAVLAAPEKEVRRLPWYFFASALAHYRAGRFEEALRRLDDMEARSIERKEWIGNFGLALLLRAMAQQRLGNAAEARAALAAAEAVHARNARAIFQQDASVEAVSNWHDWGASVLLRREATELIAGKPTPENPYSRLDRARTLARLAQPDKAETELKAAGETDDPDVMLARGRLLAAWGRPKEARADYERAADLLLHAKAPADPADRAAAAAAADRTADELGDALQEKAADAWVVLKPAEVRSTRGTPLTVQPDDSILAGGLKGPARPRSGAQRGRPPLLDDLVMRQIAFGPGPAPPETYIVVAPAGLKKVVAIRLEVLTDPSLPQQGPGRGGDGNFVLSEFQAALDGAEGNPFRFRAAFADHSQQPPYGDYGVELAIDGNTAPDSRGWAISPQFGKPHTAVFEFAEPVALADGARLAFRLIHAFPDPRLTLGRFRLSATDRPEVVADARRRLGAPGGGLVGLGKHFVAAGDPEKAAAAFAKALDPGAGDGSRREAAAQAARDDRLFAAVAKLRPDEPTLHITRGRLLAERGDAAGADAAFKRAAELVPKELGQFVQAGWWVVGPYPEDAALARSEPPEKDPDPGRPVASPGGGELAWVAAAPDANGRLDLGQVFHADHISAYALTYVYSPDERTAVLYLNGDDDVLVWLNGRSVHDYHLTDDVKAHGVQSVLFRVPVTLHAGRNVLLAKVSNFLGPHYLNLRLGDDPLARGDALVNLGLWDEAAAEYVRAMERGGLPNSHEERTAAVVLPAAGDEERYRQLCRRLVEKYGRGAGWEPARTVSFACNLGAQPVLEGKRLVERAQTAYADPAHRDHWHLLDLGLALYRAGQFDESIRTLKGLEKTPGMPQTWVVLAMDHHGLGNAEEARTWLAKATEWYDRATRDAPGARLGPPFERDSWAQAQFQILYGEARRLIDGPDWKDANARTLQHRVREKLRPETFEYDLAILLQPDQPRLYLARAVRLAELKRDKEADADFAKALELKPDDATTLAERADACAELGRLDDAAADVMKALERFDAAKQADSLERARLDGRLVRRPELLERVLRRRPDDVRLWLAAARPAIDRRDWAEARRSLEKALADHPDPALAGALADVLFEIEAARWTVLRPDERKSAGGATLTLLPDGSILAGGENPDEETYTLVSKLKASKVAAVRIETLTDPSLPRGGAGRDPNGYFLLDEVRAGLLRPDDAKADPLPLRRAVASFGGQNGPLARYLIDGDRGTRWDPWPNTNRPQWVVLAPTGPVAAPEGARLSVELESINPQWKKAALGRFRLSVSDDPDAFRNAAWQPAAANLSGWARLGAAYARLNEYAKAEACLARNPKPGTAELLFLALAQRGAGHKDEAQATFDQAAQDLAKAGTPPELRRLLRDALTEVCGLDGLEAAERLGALISPGDNPGLNEAIAKEPKNPDHYRNRAAWYAGRARWREAAADLAEAFRLEPKPLDGLYLATYLLGAGDVDAYRKHCREMMKSWSQTKDSGEADWTAKACLLRPDSGVDPKEVADLIAVLGGVDEKAPWYEWLLMNRGLHAYRSGRFDDALTLCADSRARSEKGEGVRAYLDAADHSIEAMAHLRRKDMDKARASLAAARRLIEEEFPTPDEGDLAAQNDALTAHVLYREARALVEGDELR
jgi:tetratricopeptide (TPR) repeat protein